MLFLLSTDFRREAAHCPDIVVAPGYEDQINQRGSDEIREVFTSPLEMVCHNRAFDGVIMNMCFGAGESQTFVYIETEGVYDIQNYC